jgi:hypothetical protein
MCFQQSTDRGEVSCRVSVDVWVCQTCENKSWSEHAENEIESAVAFAYGQLLL